MLDTVKLESPEISESAAAEVSRALVLRQGVDLESGEILYSVTAGQLRGSWDHSVSLRVMRERKVNVSEPVLGTGDKLGQVLYVRRHQETVACPPYLLLEGSVHKAAVGHNVYGGPESFSASCGFFVGLASDLLGVALPGAPEWLVRRVDSAEVYRLGYEGCEAFIRNIHGADYARRSVQKYATGIMWPGSNSTLKMYMKGPEFTRHDSRRLSAFMDPDEVEELQREANGLVRVECEVKARMLRWWNADELPRVSEVPEDRIRAQHVTEVRRVLHEGGEQVKKVRNHREVSDRLHEVYGKRLGNLLYGTWSRLVLGGEAEARKALEKPTFYRHKKLIKEANCNWIGSDVFSVSEGLYPEDFRPLPTDPRRVQGEHPEVSRK
ncbi:MAG: hypothetical protein M3P49_00355, partial [Actinomycetota bacterium]|nr:hypothetical protein [Actinomycetota bacterium]